MQAMLDPSFALPGSVSCFLLIPELAGKETLTDHFLALRCGALGCACRIRARLDEEDFEQVPQLATSLLIELRCLGLKTWA